MTMKDDDYRLSMRIATKGRIPSSELRSLLVNRLSDTFKAVLRRSLREDLKPNFGLYCEPCRRWTPNLTDVPDVVTCESCGRMYRMETVIYEELEIGVRK